MKFLALVVILIIPKRKHVHTWSVLNKINNVINLIRIIEDSDGFV